MDRPRKRKSSKCCTTRATKPHKHTEITSTQVICVTNLGEIQIAGFKSEALTLGIPDHNRNLVIVRPSEEVPKGGKLY